METAICRGCGAEVAFACSINGKRQIIDRAPDPEHGNLILVAREQKGVPFVIALTNLNETAREKAKAHGVKLFTDHHATCSVADRFRRAA